MVPFAKETEPDVQIAIPYGNEPIVDPEMQLTASQATENIQKADAKLAETKQRRDDAKRACDEFLKSPQSSDSIVRATELAKVFIEAQKAYSAANTEHLKAQQALLPFQVDELRAAVSTLENEIDELNKQRETFQNEYNSRKHPEKSHYNSLQITNNLIERGKKGSELQVIKQKLNEAEIAAGLKFRNNHQLHHEMLIHAAFNGGKYNVMCSCGGKVCWSVDSSYPPKCGRESPYCGKLGW